MSLIIAGKGDYSLIKRLGTSFTTYELHLGEVNWNSFGAENFEERISYLTGVNIAAVHNPTGIYVEGEKFPFDLSDLGEKGEISALVLKRTIQLAKQLNSRKVVVHGARYNDASNKEEALDLLLSRIKPLIQEGLTLSFETDGMWYDKLYGDRPLLTTVEDFKQLDAALDGNLKITADIEHMHFTFYFSKFMDDVGGEAKLRVEYPPGSLRKFEEDFMEFLEKNETGLSAQFETYLTDFFNEFKDKIDHIHLNGSDPFNFIFDSECSLPLSGEHLPLGFDDGKIKDRLNYSFLAELFSSLPRDKEIEVVLEVWRKNPDEFVSEMKKSERFLINYLKGQ